MTQEKPDLKPVGKPKHTRRSLTPAALLGYLEWFINDERLDPESATIRELISAIEHDIVVEARTGEKRNIERTTT